MSKLKFISGIVLSLVILSCSDPVEENSGLGDALIVSQKSGNSVVYGISLYAYTLTSFKSVSATSIEPVKSYTLKMNHGHSSSFYYETPEVEFNAKKPDATVFKFQAVYGNGEGNEFQDQISDKVLAPAVIDTCMYIDSKHVLRLNWKPVPEAQSYAINILNDTTLVFGSPELSTKVNAVWINKNSAGWASGFTPEAGKTYKVKVFSYLYESKISPYDMQCVSIGTANAVWGN